MSHFQNYDCKVSNVEFIKKALTEMGLGYQENVQITDYYRQNRTAELAVVSAEGKLLPVGFIRNEETGELNLQADWYMTRFSEKSFTNQLSQLHSKYQVLETCEENRWNVNEEDIVVNDAGEIEIYASQFV